MQMIGEEKKENQSMMTALVSKTEDYHKIL